MEYYHWLPDMYNIRRDNVCRNSQQSTRMLKYKVVACALVKYTNFGGSGTAAKGLVSAQPRPSEQRARSIGWPPKNIKKPILFCCSDGRSPVVSKSIDLSVHKKPTF